MKIFNTKRPWQSFAGITIYVAIIITFIYSTVKSISVYAFTFIVLQKPDIGAKFLGTFPVMLVSSLVLVIFFTVILTSIIYGKRWSVVLSILMTLVSVVYNFVNFLQFLFHGYFFVALLKFIGLFVMVGIMWLFLACLKHPFYGGNGKITVDSFKFWKKRERGVEEMTTF